MAHARQTIRDAVVTAVTGLVTTGAAVEVFAAYPIDTLPGLEVLTPDELVEETLLGSAHMRRLTVEIRGRARLAANVHDTTDTIAAEVEAAIYADPTLGGVVEDIVLTTTTTEIDAEGEQPTALVTMTWSALYKVDATDPTVIIP